MMRTIALDGVWDFVADLDPKYHARHGGFHRPAANRQFWRKVPVPGSWQKYAERYDIFEGVCWFAREFDVVDLPAGAAARFRFGGVNYLCRVFLNGEEIGSHEGGYTEFVLDATGKLQEGRNHIAVMVDNRSTTIKWPPVIGYFNYGGIHRSVALEIMSGPSLEDLWVTAVPASGGGRLQISGKVRGEHRGLKIRFECGKVNGEEDVGHGGFIACEALIPEAKPWSPEAPVLHPLRVTLIHEVAGCVDERAMRIGFRSLCMQDGGVRLNGEPLKFKGVCYVYDSPTTGLAMTPEQIETDVGMMKEAGCNAVRCHYPMDPLFYEACDRFGLLVWIEPPVYCYLPAAKETSTRFADPDWLALARQMVGEMVATARNHPSVAIYSIGNECNTNNPEAEAFFRSLAKAIRSKDATRLVSYAALYDTVGTVADLVDVLGINSYHGWYGQIHQDGTESCQPPEGSGKRPIDLEPMRAMLDKVLAVKPGLALLLTEFGADSVPGYHSRSHDLWSEDYHAELIRKIFALAEQYPQIAGTFPFCFCDYRDPSKTLNGYWNELNLKGMVSYSRVRKKAFNAVRDAYVGAVYRHNSPSHEPSLDASKKRNPFKRFKKLTP